MFSENYWLLYDRCERDLFEMAFKKARFYAGFRRKKEQLRGIEVEKIIRKPLILRYFCDIMAYFGAI